MNRLNIEERAKILGCLVEGNSIRATCRMTGAAKGTVIKLLTDVGGACQAFHDKHVRNVKSQRVQCDEIWSFCYSKEKNVPEDFKGVFGFGDVWTWTGLCADTKLIVSYMIGSRETPDAVRFMDDLRSRLANRVQLTTDGHRAYYVAVDEAFGAMWITRCCRRFTANPRAKATSAAIAPANAAESRSGRFLGILPRATFPRPTLSART